MEERVIESDNPYENLKVGSLVAVLLSNYDKYPVIGEIIELGEENVQIHYWKGSYLKSWAPHNITKSKEKIPWTDTLPKRSIILSNFILKDNKLTSGQRRYLRSRYEELNAKK